MSTLTPGSLFSNGIRPYLYLRDPVSKAYTTPFGIVNDPDAAINNMDINPAQTVLAIGGNTGKHLQLYDLTDFSEIVAISPTIGSDVNGVAFNHDGSLLAVAYETTPFLRVYNTSTWVALSDVAVPREGIAFSVAWNHDSSLLAICGNATGGTDPDLQVYETATWTQVTITGLAADNLTAIGYDVEFSPDDSLLILGMHTTPNGFQVYNTSDWSLQSAVAESQSYVVGLRISPDGSSVAMVNTTGNDIYLYDTTAWLKTTLAFPDTINLANAKAFIDWRNNDIITIFRNALPYLVSYDINTELAIEDEIVLTSMGAIKYVPESTLYEVNGTIDESLVADTWIATAHEHLSGNFLGSTEFTGAAFSIDVGAVKGCSVTVSAKQGDIWEPSLTSIVIGDKIIPTDPVSTPYYYIATVAGTTAITEPVWPVTPAGTVTDGSVTWQRVERLIQPVTQSPLVPTVKV